MASGDRIELLTADTFNSAMSTVAQEATVKECSAKVDTVDANVDSLVATVGNINNVVSADYNLDVNNYNILVDLYTNRIGTTADGGGAVGGGTMMAKLNTLISSVDSISNQSLYSTMFVPNEGNVLKTVLNSAVHTAGNYYWVGSFTAKYSGCIACKVTGYCTVDGHGGYVDIIASADIQTAPNIPIYPSMPMTDFNNNYDAVLVHLNTFNTPTVFTKYLQVKAGETYYFVVWSYNSYPAVCTNITIYGSTISYF